MKKYLSLLVAMLSMLSTRADEVTVGTGTITDSGAPFLTNYKYSTTQTIYTTDELGGGGLITSIAYNCASTGSLNSDVKIYMGYKTSDTFSSASDCLRASDLTLVYSNSQTLSSQTGWVDFDLDAPFNYDASAGNLAVVVCKSASGWKDSKYYSTSTSGKTLSRCNDDNSSYADISNTNNYSLSNSSANTRFKFLDNKIVDIAGVTYSIRASSNSAIVSYAQNLEGNVSIPSTITVDGNVYAVTRISANAFKNNTYITSVSIPESVTSIGNSAFSGCSSLESMTLPFVGGGKDASGSVALFGYIFGSTSYTGGTSASQNYLDDSSQNSATYYIPSTLRSVTITGGEINYGAFSNCSSLTSVTITEGVTSIGEEAFLSCSSLTSVTITEGVTSIGESAFSDCSSLTSINIPESVTSIGSSAFSGCYSLTSIIIPEGVTSIGSYAFYDCSSLTSIIIPEGVTSIGSYAFYDCSSLSSVTIPSSVTSIGSYAFQYCNYLKKVYNLSSLSVSAGSSSNGYVAYYASAAYNCTSAEWMDQYYFVNTTNGNNILCDYSGDSTDLTLPDNYNGENYGIGSSAFSGCSSLTSITIPESVTSIGSSAFQDCI